MRRGVVVWGAIFMVASGAAWAQSDATPTLTPTQQTGQRLFQQDCGVCHMHAIITSKLYGPALSKALVDGNEAAIANFIAQGSDRMPGFRFYYRPEQIDAIVAYLKTVPAPASTQGGSSPAPAPMAPGSSN